MGRDYYQPPYEISRPRHGHVGVVDIFVDLIGPIHSRPYVARIGHLGWALWIFPSGVRTVALGNVSVARAACGDATRAS
jgi:hypothetical protein